MFAPFLAIFRAVPIWAWALTACLAWGGFQKFRATRATKAAAVAEQRAAVEEATAKAEAAARQREQQLTTATQEAADAYRSNLAAAQRTAAAARTERDRLLVALDAAPLCRADPSASAAGGADAAARVRQVLGECVGAVQTLAEAADADAQRVMGLQGYLTAIGAASAPNPTTTAKDSP
jgi:hypothetical protein